MKKTLTIILAALMMIFSFGCSGEKETAENEPDYDTEQTEKNDINKEAAGAAASKSDGDGMLSVFSYKPDTFCPVLSNNEANIEMLKIVYDGLITLSDDLRPESALAEKWSVSQDGRVWNISLRNGVKWHNGEGFSSKDVVYTINLIKNTPGSVYAHNVSNIQSVRASGNSGVTISLMKPNPNFISLLYFPIVKYQADKIDLKSYMPVGTGAYRLEDRNEGNVYYLVRNDSWGGGTAKSAEIRVRMLPDRDTALYAFSSGSIDMVATDSSDWSKFADPQSTSHISIPTSEFTFLGINHKNAVLKMDEVRSAVSYAIDRSAALEGAMMGRGSAVNAPVRPEWFVCEGQELRYQQDMSSAKRILLENGWEAEKGSYKKLAGRKTYRLKFDILINKENTVRENAARIVKGSLEELGMTVTITSLPYDEYISRIDRGRYDMFIGSTVIPSDISFDFFVGDGNKFGFENEEMDYVLAELSKKTEPEELKRAYEEAVNLFDSINPVIGLWFSDNIMIYTNGIKGKIAPSYFDLYRGIEQLEESI